MAFKSLDALMGDIRKKIDIALGNEVAEIVKETEQQSAISEVYSVYSPSWYLRRGSAGGLADMDNMESTVSGGVLTVTNETPFNPGYGTRNSGNNLDELVEYGDGGGGHYYDYPGDPYQLPRPFIKKTIETLSLGGCEIPKAALEIGLERQGLSVK